MLIVLIVAGAVLSTLIFKRIEFALLGAFLGFVLWRLFELSTELKKLGFMLKEINTRLKSSAREESPPESVAKTIQQDSYQIPIAQSAAEESLTEPVPETAADLQSSVPEQVIAMSEPETNNVPSPKSNAIPPQLKNNQPPEFIEKAFSFVKDYFTQGNVVVRVGAVILFFGVAFLLKYAAEHSNISMEARLVVVAVGAIVLLAFGWKLRDKKQGYGLILQGTAVGILYITLFVSFRVYSILPAGFVFSMLFIFSGLAMTLAVLQNSHSLAVLSISGGFLAPVLTSTGAGSHVALFSYYAILNLGIFAVAWYRSWRLLNLIGFAFTFIIGSSWGVMKYDPANFASTEPFLIGFFLLYSAIALLFAIKQKPVLKGYVDSTLVFGLPIICFTLQAAMVKSYEFGLAWSAFALGGFYLGSAFMVLRGNNKNLKIIAEAYLALGIIFASLVIPFALDGQWTSAAWAIEGGGLIWLGLRQARWFPKYFGALIQFVGGWMFLGELSGHHHDPRIFDAELLGIIFVSMAALFSSFQIWKHREDLPTLEAKSYGIFLIWGLLWWYIGGSAEVIDNISGSLNTYIGLLLFVSLSGLVGYRAETVLSWRPIRHLSWITLFGLLAIGLIYFSFDYRPAKFFISWISIVWVASIVSYYWSLYHRDNAEELTEENQSWTSKLNPYLHFVSLLGLFSFSVIVLNGMTRFFEFRHSPWSLSLYAILAVAWMMILAKQSLWPMRRYQASYSINGQRVIFLSALFWSVVFNFSNAGIAAPLFYIPILNPLDIAQGLLLLIAVQVASKTPALLSAYSRFFKKGLMLFVFVWLNVILLRSIHSWAHVAYDLERMLSSNLVQTSLSIFWTVLGLAGTIYAARSSSRKIWIYSAGLIGVVVVKLFIIDLANTSSIERIVSFIVVGLLLLTVGYFSPLPAKEGEQHE